MIFNAYISIAVKNFYDQYDVGSFSLFELNRVNESFTSLRVKLQNNKEILLRVSCPVCGNSHYYRYSINEFMKKKLTVGGCEVLGIPLFYIGNEDEVRKKVSKHNGINKKVYAMI